MPRRSVLSAGERAGLLSLPEARDDLIRTYALSESDLRVIRRHRGQANRLGFAVQLCYMRYPGIILGAHEAPAAAVLDLVADQLDIARSAWGDYGQRSQTRREHLVELQSAFGYQAFTNAHHRESVESLRDVASETDKGIVLAAALLRFLRSHLILLPSMSVLERICSEAIAQATRRIYQGMTKLLSREQRRDLDALLSLRENSTLTTLAWLRQSPSAPSPRHFLEHVERLKTMEGLRLPAGLSRDIHPTRLAKIAREGAQMTAQHLGDLEPSRRHATIAAVVLENTATVIDDLVEWHDRMIGRLFNRAKRSHDERFTQSGKAINDKVRLYARVGQRLIDARRDGSNAFNAIEEVISWAAFTQSVKEAQQLAEPETFDFLHLVSDGYTQIRRYAPALLEALELKAAPAARDVLGALETLKGMNAAGARKLPIDAPTAFIRKRWEPLVFTEAGLDRRSYELCALSELKNSLRSGDIWVEGSRQFRDFDAYLLPLEHFGELKTHDSVPLEVPTDCDRYLEERLGLLARELETVDRLAKSDSLPDALITESGLKITPLANAVPDEADALMQRVSALLPHVKITELLLEVDEWTDFTRHFTHMKTGAPQADKQLLLTAVLADAINLGLTKMAESCPGTSYSRLSWLQAWHIRDDTYSAALADLVNSQYGQRFAAHWGDGSTSSSDAQRFKAGGRAEAGGNVNPKYGSEPGVLFYTHISDQYAPFHTKVINVGVRDATYVLDGLLYHDSDLRIEEHYTDTAGFTDHLFALMHLLDFRFAPRIRDLADKRIFVPPASQKKYAALSALTGGAINTKQVRGHWEDILRLATSIKKGTVTASLMLRKLGSYPRQNGLAIALRELGRIERSLFTLEWLQDVELRRRVHAGLNKGEAKNALARAVFFNRAFSQQSYHQRPSGLAKALGRGERTFG